MVNWPKLDDYQELLEETEFYRVYCHKRSRHTSGDWKEAAVFKAILPFIQKLIPGIKIEQHSPHSTHHKFVCPDGAVIYLNFGYQEYKNRMLALSIGMTNSHKVKRYRQPINWPHANVSFKKTPKQWAESIFKRVYLPAKGIIEDTNKILAAEAEAEKELLAWEREINHYFPNATTRLENNNQLIVGTIKVQEVQRNFKSYGKRRLSFENIGDLTLSQTDELFVTLIRWKRQNEAGQADN